MTIKARMDITSYCNHKNIKLVLDGLWVAKPRVSFALEKNA